MCVNKCYFESPTIILPCFRPASEALDGQLQDSTKEGETRESLDQKLEVDASVQQKRASRSSDGLTRGSPVPGHDTSTRQKDEGGEKATGEGKEEEEEERKRNSVPPTAADSGTESDIKLIASLEEGEGGEKESKMTGDEATFEEKRTETPPSRREDATTTTTATIETELTKEILHGGGGTSDDGERELKKAAPNDSASPSEDAPVVSGSSSVEMGSPAHSDADSPAQTNSPTPVERTDSMSSGALLLPREQ